ncbi:MAG TPA: glycosyltransferase family 2 protein [Mucilaginibacter sp.]|nr:glycosyltransferase family 2 protein [Mucilaginibacter sp.]
MSQPLVSIIIPVYNAEKYVAETVNSAINQSWPNKEILIIDDGSTDNSLAIVRKLENSWIRAYTQNNKGASAARNMGLKEAKGEYIQFLDADDLLQQDKIAHQVKLLADQPGCVTVGGTVHFFDGTDPYKATRDFGRQAVIEPLRFLLRLYGGNLIEPGYEGMIQPNAWLTPRSVIDKAGYWNEELTLDDDGEYFCRVILASENIIYSADAINYYRKFRNGVNLSAKRNDKAMKSLLMSTELKYRHLKESTDNPLVNTALAKLYMENAVRFYPEYKDLYTTAMNRVKELGPIDYVPKLGGKKIEFIKKKLGWQFAKYLLYIFSKKRT